MQFTRLFDILTYQQERYPQKVALAAKEGKSWRKFSTEDCIKAVDAYSAALLQMGLKKSDKVALIFHQTTPEWNFLDFGMQQIGVVSIPIHASFKKEEIAYILNDAEVKYCIVSHKDLHEKIANFGTTIPTLEKILSIEKIPGVDCFIDLVDPTNNNIQTKITKQKASIQEDHLATIIYTSGTTGMPKGVMLSHKNIVSNIKSVIVLIPINYHHKTVSFLPVSHIFERMVLYAYFAVGASIYYAGKMESVSDVLQKIKPEYFSTVPRLLEKVYENIIHEGQKRGGIQAKILNWAIQLGERYDSRPNMGILYWLKIKLADVLVYRKWRKALGGKVKGVVVGAAALQPKLGRLFSAAGVKIREGYGLTETSPALAFNRFEPGGVKFGTVGIPIPGVVLQVRDKDENEEGEIWVKGPNIMLGYYKKPQLTAAVFDKNGWFNTGDVGKIVHKKFLQITDRKKDIFKTSSGKYIAPQILENNLLTSDYISQCMIVGFQKPYVTALIIPDFDLLKIWCAANNVHWTAPQFMVINPKVEAFMDSEIERLNGQAPNFERVRKVHLLFEPWAIDSGELTPTLKLKRKVILENHNKVITEMYSMDATS